MIDKLNKKSLYKSCVCIRSGVEMTEADDVDDVVIDLRFTAGKTLLSSLAKGMHALPYFTRKID